MQCSGPTPAVGGTDRGSDKEEVGYDTVRTKNSQAYGEL